MDLTLIEIGARDGEQLAALNAVSFPADWGEQWSEQDVISSLSMPGVQAQAAMIGADSDAARLAGFLLSRQVVDEAEILLIGVDPQYRRAGIGKKLLADFLGRAALSGIKRVFLEVRESNYSARALYKSLGFTAMGERKNYYKQLDGRRASAITLQHHIEPKRL